MKKYLLLTLCLLSTGVHADSSQVEFKDGWIKQLPPVVPMRAGYVLIENNAKQDAKLIALQSDAFDRVELHETKMVDGMMKMMELDGLVIPAQSRVELKPGGKHLMLIDPKTPLKIGDQIDLIATFSDEKSQRIQLKVKK